VVLQIGVKYSGQCRESLHSGGNYEVCVSKQVRQVNPNQRTISFELGKFVSVEGEGSFVKQHYGNGALCPPSNNERKTSVTFACAPELQLLAIREPAICEYEIVLGVPDVCGHPKFLQVVQQNSPSKDQTWFLEIVEIAGGTSCSISHNGYGSFDAIYVESFSLEFDPSPIGQIEAKAYSIDRRELSSGEIQITSNGLKTTSQFDHNVRYVQIRYEELPTQESQ